MIRAALVPVPEAKIAISTEGVEITFVLGISNFIIWHTILVLGMTLIQVIVK